MESVDSEASSIRRVLLVGFMASGKTTVGRGVAASLGWDFYDFDRVIEEREGESPHSIFQKHGERRFREIEHRVGRYLLGLDQVVLASGGGWPPEGDHMESLPGGTLSVWLKVDAATAVERAGRDGPTRPLLDVDQPLARAEELLGVRRWAYEKADLALSSEEGFPHALADSIVRCVRQGPDRCNRRADEAAHP